MCDIRCSTEIFVNSKWQRKAIQVEKAGITMHYRKKKYKKSYTRFARQYPQEKKMTYTRFTHGIKSRRFNSLP